MVATATVTNVTTPDRFADLRTLLEDRRRTLSSAMQDRIRNVRNDSATDHEVLDSGDRSDLDIQDDLELALLQMRSETLTKVNDALHRLKQGLYGRCFECGDEISPARLRALPFAVRCKACEEAREATEQQRRGSAPLFDVGYPGIV